MAEKSSKSWLYGIIVAMFLFILFFVYLVTRIYKSDYSLVSQNSYEQGLQHDKKMETIKRAETFGCELEFFGGNNTLKLQMPSNVEVSKMSGKILFYRPSTSKLDFEIPLNLTDSKAQFFNLEKLDKGFWKVQFTYSYLNEDYYQEYSFSR